MHCIEPETKNIRRCSFTVSIIFRKQSETQSVWQDGLYKCFTINLLSSKLMCRNFAKNISLKHNFLAILERFLLHQPELTNKQSKITPQHWVLFTAEWSPGNENYWSMWSVGCITGLNQWAHDSGVLLALKKSSFWRSGEVKNEPHWLDFFRLKLRFLVVLLLNPNKTTRRYFDDEY